MKTLIIVDLQNDFLPGGALAVPEGDVIIPIINKIESQFDLVVATQDWHVKNHVSFASRHPHKKLYDHILVHGMDQILWPDHCVQGSFGAELSSKLDSQPIEAIFRKGTDSEIDSYSSFYDNNHLKSTGLEGYLREKGATNLYFCGLAADFCVYFSIKDALAEGFNCWIIEDATRAIDVKGYLTKKDELLALGVKVITSSTI